MSFLANMFGRGKSPQEMMREYQRVINKTIREIDRSRQNLQREEKKLIIEIKNMAKQNQMNAVQILAKDLIRTRKHITKFYSMHAQMQAVGLRLQTLRSTASMTTAMKGVAKALGKMNKQINAPQMAKIMKEFEKQSEQMDFKEEILNDAIDDAMDDEEDEEESNAVVSQVLDELGLDLQGKLGETPTNAVSNAQGEEEEESMGDLHSRLQELRRT